MKKAIYTAIMAILLFTFLCGAAMSVETGKDVAIMFALVFGSAFGMRCVWKKLNAAR